MKSLLFLTFFLLIALCLRSELPLRVELAYILVCGVVLHQKFLRKIDFALDVERAATLWLVFLEKRVEASHDFLGFGVCLLGNLNVQNLESLLASHGRFDQTLHLFLELVHRLRVHLFAVCFGVDHTAIRIDD